MTGDDAPADDLHDAVAEFLDGADAALDEYDRGYADADATLRVIRDRLGDLRDAADG
ncbi:MAG: hypothetical protein ABEJ40_08805 [Haloarculaceae archaeon]